MLPNAKIKCNKNNIKDAIVKTKQIEEARLSRTIIKNYDDQNLLIRESQGVYIVSSPLVDEYKLLQNRSEMERCICDLINHKKILISNCIFK